MEYRPPSARAASTQYRDLLAQTIEQGEWVPTKQGVKALTFMQQSMSFRLSEGFPLITERSIRSFWRKPIGELCAFINGATTVAELASYGCDWWNGWATEEKTAKKGLQPGDIGPGSYGGAFRYFPTSEGTPFDQFANLVEQIKEVPSARTHFVSPWIPQYQARGAGKVRRTTIAPCHGWVHVRVINARLHLNMFQRAADLPIGVPSNMVQYAALLLMLEQLTGYAADTYYHTISDGHIYENQVPFVTEMLARTPRSLPTVVINAAGRDVSDIHDFRAEHFDLTDYDPHPAITAIPVAI
jgi:thymidylate synthase